MLISTILWLLFFVVIGLLIAMLVSPFESLGWWAGWQTEETIAQEIQEQVDQHIETAPDASDTRVQRYVVFLTGIGGFAVDQLLDEEVRLLNRLMQRLPNIKFVTDIYPYSPTERGLTHDSRMFSWFWDLSVDKKLQGRPLGLVVNLRNLLQVLVASDKRYSIVFGRGASDVVIKGLKRHNYPFGSGMPVTLLGFSGGGAVAVSTAQYLQNALDAPVTIVSLAGVFSADSGLDHIERMIHIYGSKDNLQRIGVLAFPRRWRLMVLSRFNQLRRNGHIQAINIGKLTHNGPRSYFDDELFYADGVTYLDHSAEQIAQAIEQLAEPIA